jgi:hypothetical protein
MNNILAASLVLGSASMQARWWDDIKAKGSQAFESLKNAFSSKSNDIVQRFQEKKDEFLAKYASFTPEQRQELFNNIKKRLVDKKAEIQEKISDLTSEQKTNLQKGVDSLKQMAASLHVEDLLQQFNKDPELLRNRIEGMTPEARREALTHVEDEIKIKKAELEEKRKNATLLGQNEVLTRRVVALEQIAKLLDENSLQAVTINK